MREVGFVDEINGEYAVVRVAKKSACGENCASCKGGCTPGERKLTVKNKTATQKGDRVILELPENKLLSAAFITYILPLIIFFVGFFVGDYIFKGELMAVFSGGIIMFFGIFIIHLYDKKNKDKYMAEIVGILDR